MPLSWFVSGLKVVKLARLGLKISFTRAVPFAVQNLYALSGHNTPLSITNPLQASKFIYISICVIFGGVLVYRPHRSLYFSDQIIRDLFI